ncbi:MAG: AzlD domain-containing protein [Eubacteriales bacterium]|nr:AzlD domain-containing protein [Eubacteriales bacterium]
METATFFLYLLVMAGVTYLIRMLPLVFVRREIKSPFLRSFLHYVPYAVLGAMTFPAVFGAAGALGPSLCGLAVAVALGLMEKGLLTVAVAACAAAYAASLIL